MPIVEMTFSKGMEAKTKSVATKETIVFLAVQMTISSGEAKVAT
jgi:hypothetical protein